MHMMELPGNKVTSFTPQQAASQKSPLQFLHNLANAVLDNKTGDLLEYWHLIKRPKYRETWSKSFGMEIQCLATMTGTIFLWTERKYHKTDSVTSHTVASAAIIGNKKRMHIKLASPWERT